MSSDCEIDWKQSALKLDNSCQRKKNLIFCKCTRTPVTLINYLQCTSINPRADFMPIYGERRAVVPVGI
jgi:hypothetical protein